MAETMIRCFGSLLWAAPQKNDYTRRGIGTLVGPMPPMGSIIKDSDDLWKMITFIRSRFDGDPAYKYGVPASQQ
jgi:hypothetical protein